VLPALVQLPPEGASCRLDDLMRVGTLDRVNLQWVVITAHLLGKLPILVSPHVIGAGFLVDAIEGQKPLFRVDCEAHRL